MSTRTTHTLQGETGSCPRADITHIGNAGINLDGISGCCGRNRRARSCEWFSWTHLQDSCLLCARQCRQRQNYKRQKQTSRHKECRKLPWSVAIDVVPLMRPPVERPWVST